MHNSLLEMIFRYAMCCLGWDHMLVIETESSYFRAIDGSFAARLKFYDLQGCRQGSGSLTLILLPSWFSAGFFLWPFFFLILIYSTFIFTSILFFFFSHRFQVTCHECLKFLWILSRTEIKASGYDGRMFLRLKI